MKVRNATSQKNRWHAPGNRGNSRQQGHQCPTDADSFVVRPRCLNQDEPSVVNARKIVPALHNEKLGKVICQICLLFCNHKKCRSRFQSSLDSDF